MTDSICGKAVKIRANDFIARDTFARIVLADDASKRILLALDVPLEVARVVYTHAIASPRLGKDSLSDLLSKGVLASAVTWVPNNKFDQNRALDISWWRGGGAVVTDIILIS